MDRKLEPYFPLAFRWLGAILILTSGLTLMQGNWYWPPVMTTTGVLFLFAKNGIRLDLNDRRYQVYFGIFGIKFGRWQPFPALDKIIIIKSNYSRIVGSRVSQTEVRSHQFQALLRQGKEFKLPFESGVDYRKVLQAASSVSKSLDLPILDCTKTPPSWIN